MRALAMLALSGFVGWVGIGCKSSDPKDEPPAQCAANEHREGDRCVPTLPTCGENEVPALDGTSCVGVGVPADGCAAGFRHDGHGGCDPVLPEAPCVGGTMAVPGDSACRVVGVAKCGAGFASDGKGSCDAILPSAACAKGEMAVPGETSCRSVASCGAAPFGDAPVDSTTLYVDASFSGTSDGSKSNPFVTIQQALDKASSTAPTIIAIAAGTYDENLDTTKPVRIFGRCPSMVEIHGKVADTPTVRLGAKAELHRVAITGISVGVTTSAEDVRLEKLWVHDTGSYGVNTRGGAKVVLEGSLIERVTSVAVVSEGTTLTVDASVVRDTQKHPGDDIFGRGIEAHIDPTTKTRSVLTVRRSLLERNASHGMFIAGSTASVTESVVRDTRSQASDGKYGRGIHVQVDVTTKERGKLDVQSCLFERNADAGIGAAASDVTIVGTVIRDTKGNAAAGTGGHGVNVQLEVSEKLQGNVVIRDSTIERNAEVGVVSIASLLTLERTIVRDGVPREKDGIAGRGIEVNPHPKSGLQGELVMKGCLIDHNYDMGVLVSGSKGLLESSVVRGTMATKNDGTFGLGIAGQIEVASKMRADLTVKGSLVERNMDLGIFVGGSPATIEGTLIRDIEARPSDGKFGSALAAQCSPDGTLRAEATVRGCVIERATGSGLESSGSDLVVENTIVRGYPKDAAKPKNTRGIQAQLDKLTRVPSKLTVRRSSIVDSLEIGIAVVGATAQLEGTLVDGSRPSLLTAGAFGDGLMASLYGDVDASVTITSSLIRNSARAGVSTFGATLQLKGGVLSCNKIDVDVESAKRTSSSEAVAATLEDLGRNFCACTAVLSECHAQSASLAPVADADLIVESR